jgi:uncharacterized membrane protein YkoI
MKKLALALLLVGCGSSTPSSTSQPSSPLSGVPTAVAEALQREAGSAKIESVEHETEGGAEMYEGRWVVDGLSHEVTVKADGTVVEREDEVAPDQVPESVRASANAALPGAQKVVFVKLSSGNYEAEAMIDGKEREVTVSATGALVPDDDDDKDDGDKD